MRTEKASSRNNSTLKSVIQGAGRTRFRVRERRSGYGETDHNVRSNSLRAVVINVRIAKFQLVY